MRELRNTKIIAVDRLALHQQAGIHWTGMPRQNH